MSKLIKLKDIKEKKVSELTKEQQIRILLLANEMTMKEFCNEIGINQGFASNVISEALKMGKKPMLGTRSEELFKLLKSKLGVNLL